MRKLFGTDGMRGVAGTPPLDGSTLYRLGRALAVILARAPERSAPPRVLLGRDTRESCGWIAAALSRGIRDGGGEPVSAGVLPTPGLALLTRRDDFAAGLMVSASHNPYEDNGVKVFAADGSKLSDHSEASIEAEMEALGDVAPPVGDDAATDDHDHLLEEYLAFLDHCREGVDLEGVLVALDCAHGAAHQVGPEAFRRAGAGVVVTGDAPDGRNINDGVGSLHPEVAAELVRSSGASLGFCFDGDADRCIAIAGDGTILDGDFLLYYMGCALHRAGQLKGATVVATVMSNLGLEKALEAEGLAMLRTPVGDRYVLEALRRRDLSLGGEQSGHVILMDYAPTGDGVLTALTLARMWKQGAGDLLEAAARIRRYPQVLKNVRVRSKPAIADHPVLAAAVADAERRMAGEGRVVVRYSGTEPKARVMIEGADARLVEDLADELVTLFERELG
ncbi:MAG: phosphoglucosamine mutase [Acidobacteriota bacterium]|nr:phosphoglucosamine mutase [Acidobacteriota bacterium]MDQ7087681.1 phosphoglucosamine mutase [Acidobacteriota bacterium]